MNCPLNCGCKVIMERNAKDIQCLFKLINRMIGWVIISSATIILYLSVIGINFILKHFQ